MKQKNEEMCYVIWDEYNRAKIQGVSIYNQTMKFFSELDQQIFHRFVTSEKQIVQFGCGSANYITSLTNRNIVGYEYSKTAIQDFRVNHKQHTIRDINLDAQHNSTLDYAAEITHDLRIPSDIMMIRVIEYLSPDALILLTLALIQQAACGTTFYIEVAHSAEDEHGQSLQDIGFITPLKAGYIASFFAPRTDMRFDLHTAETRDETNQCVPMHVEKLVVTKMV